MFDFGYDQFSEKFIRERASFGMEKRYWLIIIVIVLGIIGYYHSFVVENPLFSNSYPSTLNRKVYAQNIIEYYVDCKDLAWASLTACHDSCVPPEGIVLIEDDDAAMAQRICFGKCGKKYREDIAKCLI